MVRANRKSVKLVRQLAARDCGAACLAMILTYHGRETTLAQARELTPVGRDGITAAAIAIAANSEGLETKGRLLKPGFDLSNCNYPLIAHWRGDHFVVISAADAKGVKLFDPAIGTKQISLEQFWEEFSGVVLEFSATQALSLRKNEGRHVWAQYWATIRNAPHLKQRLFEVIGMATLLQLLLLSSPIITWLIVDKVLGESQPDLLTAVALLAVVIVVTTWGSRILQSFSLLKLRQRIDSYLEESFVAHTMNLRLDFFEAHGSGDMLSRFSAVSIVRQVMTESMVTALLEGAFLLVYAAILLFVAPLFLLIIFIAGLIYLLLLWISWGWLHSLRQYEIETGAQQQSILVQAIAGIESIKALGAEPHVVYKWKEKFRAFMDASIKSNRATQLMASFGPAVSQAVNFSLLILGASLVISGTYSLGAMLAIVGIGVMAIAPFQTIMLGAQQLVMAQTHVERLLEVLNTPVPEEMRKDTSSSAREKIDFSGKIELQNVSLQYTPDSQPSLRNIDLAIEPGTTVAIVGPSGSGKSTVLRLMLGLAQPTNGEIFFDGKNASALDMPHLREQMAAVMQKPFMVGGSLRDNILVGNKYINDEDRETRVVAAAKSAGLWNEIQEMPMGLSTIISETGSGLSGGQLQRLSLARAFARDPAILFLDEATNSLDTLSEALIGDAIANANCTVVVVAHRLSTIRGADKIIVLSQGSVAEQGTHENLIALDGVYATLVKSQSLE